MLFFCLLVFSITHDTVHFLIHLSVYVGENYEYGLSASSVSTHLRNTNNQLFKNGKLQWNKSVILF